MASALNTKINSYTLERGIEFSEAYSLTPTRTGSNPLGAFNLSGSAPVYDSTTGPAGGAGSWRYTAPATSGTRFGSTAANELAGISDEDWTQGWWFKLSAVPTTTPTATLSGIQLGGITPIQVSAGWQASIAPIGSTLTGPGGISLAGRMVFNFTSSFQGGGVYTPVLEANRWYYVAVRRVGTLMQAYLDGVFIGSETNIELSATPARIFFGSTTHSNNNSPQFWISNYHQSTASAVDATAIAEIWAVGSSGGATNISFNATAITANAEFAPADGVPQSSVSIISPTLTASATHVDSNIIVNSNVNFIVWGADIENGGFFGLLGHATTSDFNGGADPVVTTTTNKTVNADPFLIDPVSLEPTIVIADRENIEVVTSIPVSATIVQPAVIVDLSLNIVLIETLNASATSVNATFSQTADSNNYPQPVTASALMVDPSNIISDNQVVITATAYAVSATIVNPPLIISDNSAIVPADILSMSLLIVDPVYGTPPAPPLYYTPGTLKSKIATYAVQTGTEFNTNVASITSVTSYGTLPSTFSAFNTFDAAGYTPIYDATDGPFASGTGCWKLANSRTRTTLQAGISSDLNYTLGIWFKLPTLSTGTANEGMRLFTLGTSTVTSTSLDFSVSLTGSSHTTQPSKLAVSLNGTTYDYLTTPVNTTEWYYLAVRRTGSAGVNNFEVYINGELKLVKTNSDTSATYSSFHIGNNGASANGGSIKFQNFHATTATTLTSYEINQIWLAGTQFPPAQSVNAVHSADRFLATALSMSPTIVSTKGDHIEVTTSVTVSSFFPEPSWSTGDNLKFNTGFFGGIQAIMGDNIQIETNGDKSITPEAFLSSAILVEPILSRQPAKANASLPMPAVYTAPNYFSLVTVHQPVFYIEDGQATPNNYGSWQATGWNRQYIDVNVQSGQEMNAVGNQKSWMANANSVILHRPELQANIPDYRTKINDLYASRNLTIEIWYTSIGYGSTTNTLAYEESGPIFNDGITQITEVWDFFGCIPGSDPQNKIMLIGERLKSYDFSNLAGAFATWRSFPDANPKRDEWNHLVVTYESVTNPQQIRRKIYLNSGIVSNQLLTISNTSLNPNNDAFTDAGLIDISLDQPQNIWSGPMIGGGIQLSGSQTIKLHDGVKVDEFAIYPKTLSGTQVVEHYNFIKSLSPDTRYNSTVTEFRVQIGNHQVIPVQNTIFDEDPMPALAARIPEPVIIPGRSKTLAPDEAMASALIVNPSVTTNSIINVDPMLANANLERVYVANNQYYNYVKTIPNLHRYYSFDTATPLENHGSDTTYAVPSINVSGSIVQYGQSINNKSAITAGVSPLNGITLYESQHDDSWGSVGSGNFFTSFWMERPYNDFSAPGLRIVANINSPSNNHYVLLYQLGGLLWLDTWDGTTLVRSSSTTNPALFGYGTNQVLISFDNPRHIRVYVNKVLFIEQNIGNMDLEFTNGGVDAPNDSANNYPRMSLGSLITPFEITSLPQYPSNIRCVYDEIIWANTNATSTIINALYNNMPTRTNSFNESNIGVASGSALLMDPTVSTGTTITADSMLAFPAQTEPAITTVYSTLIETDSMDATTDINDAVRSDSRNVVAGLFLATFGLGSGGTPRIINATPLTASLSLVNRTVTGVQTGQGNAILINGQRTFDPNSKWVQYVLSTTENTLIPMREVR